MTTTHNKTQKNTMITKNDHSHIMYAAVIAIIMGGLGIALIVLASLRRGAVAEVLQSYCDPNDRSKPCNHTLVVTTEDGQTIQATVPKGLRPLEVGQRVHVYYMPNHPQGTMPFGQVRLLNTYGRSILLLAVAVFGGTLLLLSLVDAHKGLVEVEQALRRRKAQ